MEDYTPEQLKKAFDGYAGLQLRKHFLENNFHPYAAKDSARNLKKELSKFKEETPEGLVGLLEEGLAEIENKIDIVSKRPTGGFVRGKLPEGSKHFNSVNRRSRCLMF